MMDFTHLLVEAKSKYSTNLKPYSNTHDILDVIDGFSHITFNYNLLPPVKIKTKPSIYILKRKDGVCNKRVKKNAGQYITEDINFNSDESVSLEMKDAERDENISENLDVILKEDLVLNEENNVKAQKHINKASSGVKQNIKNIIQQMNEEENLIPAQEQDPKEQIFIETFVEEKEMDNFQNTHNKDDDIFNKNFTSSDQKENYSSYEKSEQVNDFADVNIQNSDSFEDVTKREKNTTVPNMEINRENTSFSNSTNLNLNDI